MSLCRQSLRLSSWRLASASAALQVRAPAVRLARKHSAVAMSSASSNHESRRNEGDQFLKEILPRLLETVYKTYTDRDG